MEKTQQNNNQNELSHNTTIEFQKRIRKYPQYCLGILCKRHTKCCYLKNERLFCENVLLG